MTLTRFSDARVQYMHEHTMSGRRSMQLRSSAFSDGEAIPRRFTCEGEDLSPPLHWSDAPVGTRSFVILCDDPDARSGFGVIGRPSTSRPIASHCPRAPR